MTTVYLVRHAHSNYSTDERNRPLSLEGVLAANRVGEILQKEPVDVVLSSPYKRAIQTVEPIASIINVKVEIIEGFKERRLSTKPVDDFESAIIQLWKEETYSFDGGESNNDAQIRGIQALKETLNRYHNKNIVIGTHGNILALIMNHFDAKYDFSFWSRLDMPDIYKLIFTNDKLNVVERIWEPFLKKENICSISDSP